MSRPKVLCIAIILLITSNYSVVFPCTTFVLRCGGHLYFGRNLDWVSGTGLIMTNHRNLEKIALLNPEENPARWVSRYGSISFNQVGKDLPYGGINEEGLVVEHMTLDKTIYPDKDSRSAIKACQWIQYQLDNCKTVEDVLQTNKVLRITDHESKFHFLICDRFGHTATIEFLDGKMISHSGNDLKAEALANSTFDESTACLNNFRTKRDSSQINSDRSLYNFTTAAQMISQVDSASSNAPAVDYAFSILRSVSQGIGTKWSIVYDITDMKIYVKVFETPVIIGPNKIFRKTPGEAKIKIIDMKSLNFDCQLSAQVLDLELDKEGFVNKDFEDYTTKINKQFITKAFKFFKDWWQTDSGLKEEEMDYLAQYPESFKCR